MRIAIVGVGLIGGSIAMAARDRASATTVGWDPDAAALHRALELNAITSASPTLKAAVESAEITFVAAPVGQLAATVQAVLDAAPEDSVVTDVGSTKRAITDAVDDPRFVGGHPLAGAETSGVANARADLFAGATWYLTPGERTSGVLYERLHRLLLDVGARPAALDADTHDRLMAAVSHLPHVLANVLVAQAARALSENGPPTQRLPATGPSFRDATRVAGAPTSIWGDIYLSNADALTTVIDDTIARLQGVREALSAGDEVRIAAWNDAAREDRRRLLEVDLAGGEVCELRVSVPNRPGVVAQVAVELGRNAVNIVDMALYPAPDNASGSIALWIAGAGEAQRARELLGGLGFAVASA